MDARSYFARGRRDETRTRRGRDAEGSDAKTAPPSVQTRTSTVCDCSRGYATGRIARRLNATDAVFVPLSVVHCMRMDAGSVVTSMNMT